MLHTGLMLTAFAALLVWLFRSMRGREDVLRAEGPSMDALGLGWIDDDDGAALLALGGGKFGFEDEISGTEGVVATTPSGGVDVFPRVMFDPPVPEGSVRPSTRARASRRTRRVHSSSSSRNGPRRRSDDEDDLARRVAP